MELDTAKKWVEEYKRMGLRMVNYAYQSEAEGYALTILHNGDSRILKNSEDCKAYLPYETRRAALDHDLDDEEEQREQGAMLNAMVGVKPPPSEVAQRQEDFRNSAESVSASIESYRVFPDTRVQAIRDLMTEKKPTMPRTAPEFLERSKVIMEERGKTYDSPTGERSAWKTVEIFNLLTGHGLSESDGWLFLLILKLVRQRQGDKFHRDSVEDMVTYAALLAESMAGVEVEELEKVLDNPM